MRGVERCHHQISQGARCQEEACERTSRCWNHRDEWTRRERERLAASLRLGAWAVQVPLIAEIGARLRRALSKLPRSQQAAAQDRLTHQVAAEVLAEDWAQQALEKGADFLLLEQEVLTAAKSGS